MQQSVYNPQKAGWKQFSPQAGKRRFAMLHSICLSVAVSTFVAKIGNFNCR